VEQKYNEIRRPVYDKRNDIIKSIPDFWLTAVSNPFPSMYSWECTIFFCYDVKIFSLINLFPTLCSF
jgi:hypothetical protein